MDLVQKFIPFLLLLSFLVVSVPLTTSKPVKKSPPPSPPPPPSDSDLCNGVFVSYNYKKGSKIPPNDSTDQPYRFESVLTVLNNGREELKSWRVFVKFVHNEILVSATNAVLSDGSSFPVSVENGTVFSGYPSSDLKSAIQTAGDITQMQAKVELVGTQFGVAPPRFPLPKNISLVTDGWKCPKPTQKGKSVLEVCCKPDPNYNNTVTIEKFLPRQDGDLTIMYDVIKTEAVIYTAQVTLENHNPLGRLDNWKLSFDWMRDEFINTMRGAYPSIVDSSDCIDGPQAKQYQDLDFSEVLSCARRPTIIDLPLTKFNDSMYGKVPFCCRNGTILPKSMDPTKSSSVFQMDVYKMPPDLNISVVSPPQNWRINGAILNPVYKCGPPVRVDPSEFIDPRGLPSNRTAFASWQVVCNITKPKNVSPKCCVSFSAFFSDSVVPCKTCACGCSKTAKTCSTTAPALLLPQQALLVPFENRTTYINSWAELKHLKLPNPMPCGDNCGVSINWHLATDYKKGWTARVTIFNWDETDLVDWFTAAQLKSAVPGFEKAYSFNATSLSSNGGEKNNTIFMKGLPGLNYLIAEDQLKNPRVPGKQQSVISFTKKLTPGINIRAGDGFPSKVLFNGEECSLPSVLPMSSSHQWKPISSFLMALPILAFLIL